MKWISDHKNQQKKVWLEWHYSFLLSRPHELGHFLPFFTIQSQGIKLTKNLIFILKVLLFVFAAPFSTPQANIMVHLSKMHKNHLEYSSEQVRYSNEVTTMYKETLRTDAENKSPKVEKILKGRADLIL